MNNNVMFMIIGMAVVTYIPRMLPLVVLNGKKMPPFLQGVLKNVPYAALGALTIPGVIFVDGDDKLFGVLGAVIAFLLAYTGANVIIVVLSTIIILSIYTFFL